MVDPNENPVDETPEGSPDDAIDRAHESSDIRDRLAATLSGRYRIDRLLGEGGMATVYLAKDLRHERQVALKVMRPDLAAVVGGKRFLSEIKTTANLQHPNILPLYDSGEADGLLYYVMPYVEEESLRKRLDREGQLSIADATKIVTEVAEALQAAHDHGVIHRDIKPANILLSGGKPLVSDFGIAVAMTAAGGTRLTDTGLSVGTPSYMSPEQAAGDRAVGPASDIYSLACVLYETLVGDPPHVGSSAQAILGKIISSQPPSAIAQRPSIPDHIEAALRKGLEKLPADRFRSAADFAEALADESFRHGRPAGVSSASPWNVQTLLGWGTAAALAIALGWSLVGRQDSRAGTEVRRGVERFSLAPHESQPAALQFFSLAPDGRAMVYVGRPKDGQQGLWLRRWEDLTPQSIPGTEGAGLSVFSPDGGEIAFMVGGRLKVVSLRGHSVRTVADSAWCCPDWGSDGYLYFTHRRDHTVFRVPASGGVSEQVTRLQDPDEGSHYFLHVRPELDLGLFQVDDGDGQRIEAIRLSTGERKVLASGMKPLLTPAGHVIFASKEGRLFAAPLDTEAMELTDDPVPLVDGVSIGQVRFLPMYDVSRSGTLIYVSGLGGGQQMEWVARSGASTPIDPDWVGGFWEIELSPDGSRVAFADGLRATAADIWIKHLDRGPLVRVTRSGEQDGIRNMGPAWTPDGSSLLFASEYDVYRKRAGGVGARPSRAYGLGRMDRGRWQRTAPHPQLRRVPRPAVRCGNLPAEPRR